MATTENKENTPSMDVDSGAVEIINPTTVTKTHQNKQLQFSQQQKQLPWVEKYRPQRLEDLVSHDDIISILTNLINSDNLPHLLFYGPPGTGKTSTIIAAAKKMYQTSNVYSSMTLELNASDSRGIDVVRNEIKEFAGTKQLNFAAPSPTATNEGGTKKKMSSIKLIILDEADAMTSDAQFALRRIIEKYSKNCRFCLICNYISKIIPALQSRCTKFRFKPLNKDQILGRLQEIVDNEPSTNGGKTTEDGINAILQLSNGDMRRVLNLLQATSMSIMNTNTSNDNATMEKKIDETAVYLTSGSPLPKDIDAILYLLLNEDFKNSYDQIVSMSTSKGYALADILEQLTHKLMQLQLNSNNSNDNTNNVHLILAKILDGMSNVQYRLSFGTDEKIQIASLVGVFIETRALLKIA